MTLTWADTLIHDLKDAGVVGIDQLLTDDGPVVSVSISAAGDYLEAEQVPGLPGLPNLFVLTARAYDRTNGLADEYEVGSYPEAADVVAGVQGFLARLFEEAEDDYYVPDDIPDDPWLLDDSEPYEAPF